jgi:phosphohistidine phosphatase
MIFFILRHGKAEDSRENLKDFDRHLSKKGEKQAHKMGQFLADKGIEQIISSSAQRTMDTTLIVNEYLKVDDITFVNDLYLADLSTIKENISTLARKNKVLFVGHNFGISDLVSDLSGQYIGLSTCQLAYFKMEVNDWQHLSSETGSLIEIISPKQL